MDLFVFILHSFNRKFRVIDGPTYLKKFASDRRHMIRDGIWLKEPPNYKPISTPGLYFSFFHFLINIPADYLY